MCMYYRSTSWYPLPAILPDTGVQPYLGVNPSNTKNEEQGDNRKIMEWNTGVMMLQSFLYRSGSRPSMPYDVKISVLAQEGIALEVRILVISLLLLLITLPKKKTKVQVPVVGCEK